MVDRRDLGITIFMLSIVLAYCVWKQYQ